MSGSEYCDANCPDEVKTALLGSFTVNDLAESSFVGVTSMLQCYGRIGLNNAAAVTDIARNGFLSCDITYDQDSNEQLLHVRGIFYHQDQVRKATKRQTDQDRP